MRPARTLGIAAIGAFFCCCTSTESAIGPLGFGPLAKAELAQRTAAEKAPQRPSKPARSARPTDGTPASRQESSPTRASSTGGAFATGDEPRHTSTAPDGGLSATAKAADWVGLWKGKDTTRFQIPNFPSEPMTDDQARIRIDSKGSSELVFVLIDSSNDQDLCSLSATLIPPNQARIGAGQDCFGSEDDSFDLSVHVKAGSAKLEEATLTLDIVLDASLVSDQAQGNGSVEYHFEGKR